MAIVFDSKVWNSAKDENIIPREINTSQLSGLSGFQPRESSRGKLYRWIYSASYRHPDHPREISKIGFALKNVTNISPVKFSPGHLAGMYQYCSQ